MDEQIEDLFKSKRTTKDKKEAEVAAAIANIAANQAATSSASAAASAAEKLRIARDLANKFTVNKPVTGGVKVETGVDNVKSILEGTIVRNTSSVSSFS